MKEPLFITVFVPFGTLWNTLPQMGAKGKRMSVALIIIYGQAKDEWPGGVIKK